MPTLILASTSPYRSALLARLGLPFTRCAPRIGEALLPGERAGPAVKRLARQKADAVALGRCAGIVIACDQLAEADEEVLGKPGSVPAAIAQLQRLSGRRASFFTALCVVDCASGRRLQRVDHTRVVFRRLETSEIARYVARERPVDCAGAFKCEGLGIALFDAIESADPTALIGLPLIALCESLRALGLNPLLGA